jgi:hypothetical protein
MVLRTITSVIAATVLAYAATASAGPTKVTAPPDRDLHAYFEKHGPDKYQRSKSPTTSPPDAALQAYYEKHGPDKYQRPLNPANSAPGAAIQAASTRKEE